MLTSRIASHLGIRRVLSPVVVIIRFPPGCETTDSGRRRWPRMLVVPQPAWTNVRGACWDPGDVFALFLLEGSAGTETPGLGRPADRLGSRPSLEGVRGLAVLLVLAVHLGQFVVPSTGDWFVPGGFIGVDIFFVLSGFLI